MWKSAGTELYLRPSKVLRTSIRHSQSQKRRKADKLASSPQFQGLRTKKKEPTELALGHFDLEYKRVFGNEWHSIRLGLLSRPKFCALVNNFAPAEETTKNLTDLGCENIKDLFSNRSTEPDTEPVRVDGPEEPPVRPSLVEKDDELDDHRKVDRSMSTNPEVLSQRLIRADEQAISGDQSTALYDFVPTNRLKGMEEFVEEAEYYQHYEKVTDFPIEVRKDPTFEYPRYLSAFVYPRGNLDRFPPPKSSIIETYDYFCFDAASLVPVIALGIQPGDEVLDMCSGPGGKALAIMQTMLPAKLVCNDSKGDRLRRVMNLMHQYLGDIDNAKDRVEFKRWDAADLYIPFSNTFDKVLCDVPCFTDRHVLHVNENNIFHPTRSKERLRLPKLQANLLASAMQCVKPGGSVVYSTCSLSPVQNDGVVHAALKMIWEETKIEFAVRDMTSSLQPLEAVMKLSGREHGLRYGTLILPFLPMNFGPMYVAKLTRST